MLYSTYQNVVYPTKHHEHRIHAAVLIIFTNYISVYAIFGT